jgi:hypothetical protein
MRNSRGHAARVEAGPTTWRTSRNIVILPGPKTERSRGREGRGASQGRSQIRACDNRRCGSHAEDETDDERYRNREQHRIGGRQRRRGQSGEGAGQVPTLMIGLVRMMRHAGHSHRPLRASGAAANLDRHTGHGYDGHEPGWHEDLHRQRTGKHPRRERAMIHEKATETSHVSGLPAGHDPVTWMKRLFASDIRVHGKGPRRSFERIAKGCCATNAAGSHPKRRQSRPGERSS